MRIILFWMLAGFLASCITRGSNFSSDMTWLKQGETTRQDLETALGVPFKVGNSSGTPTWTYGYYHYSLFGASLMKELKVYWTSDGLVKDYSFSSSFPEDKKRHLYTPK